MNKQQSPFAELSGTEQQIRWLEYQSIRLPYTEANIDTNNEIKQERTSEPVCKKVNCKGASTPERPQPPPEVPRTLPHDYQKSQHRQYDAVIARMKQAELQTRRQPPQSCNLL